MSKLLKLRFVLLHLFTCNTLKCSGSMKGKVVYAPASVTPITLSSVNTPVKQLIVALFQ